MSAKITNLPPRDGLSVKPGYVIEPVEAHIAGGERRLRNHAESPMTLAYHRGQLQGGIIRDEQGKPKYTSADRLWAGAEFKQIWLALGASGRDSTDLDRVDGNGTGSISVVQAEALRRYGNIAKHLNKQDREIVQHVCGEDWWPSVAIRYSCGPAYVDATVPRLCEALDNLIEALGKAKRKLDTPPEKA